MLTDYIIHSKILKNVNHILFEHTCEWLLILLQLVEQIGQLHLGQGESSEMLFWKGRKTNAETKSCFRIFTFYTILTGFRHPKQTGFFMHPGPSTMSGSDRKTSPAFKSLEATVLPSFINVSFTMLFSFDWVRFVSVSQKGEEDFSRKAVVSTGQHVVLCCAMFHSFHFVSEEKLLSRILSIFTLFSNFACKQIDYVHFIKPGLDWWNGLYSFSTNKLWKKIDWF